jgi:hypothetical protein
MTYDPMTVANSPLPDLTKLPPAEAVGLYVALRDAKAIVEDTMKKQIKTNITSKMDVLADLLKGFIEKNKLDGVYSDAGTAYLHTVVSVTIADKREFQRHVIGVEGWHLIDWKANKTAVRTLVEDGEPVPTGLNYSAAYRLGVRRPGEKDDGE